ASKVDADQLLESLRKERSEKSVSTALDWLEANPVHFQIESVMEEVLATPRTPATVDRLLKFVKKNPQIASTCLAVLIKRCGRTTREVVVAAKDWLTDNPFDPSAG